MPIPKPEKGESRAKFMERCMGDEVMVREYEKTQRAAICEVQTEYTNGEPKKKCSFRVSFNKNGRKLRQGYDVDAYAGSMQAVSLIQLGEARGHGIYVDELSLGSALEVLGSTNLPAFITHKGALKEDRMLKQVGFFSGFYIDEGKLKAEKFRALESFRQDESESFNRLFDLASEMPDAFGLSLVFEADLVWVSEDGKEVSIKEDGGDRAVRDLPSIRFISISSADFVDEPAANEDGLFSKNTQTDNVMPDEPKEEQTEIALEEPTEVKPEEKPEVTVEDKLEEDKPAEEQLEEGEKLEEEYSEQEEIDHLRDLIGKHDDRLNMLEDGIADLKERLSAQTSKSEALESIIDGEAQPLGSGIVTENDSANITDKFLAANGAEANRLWKQNKQAILSQYKRA